MILRGLIGPTKVHFVDISLNFTYAMQIRIMTGELTSIYYLCIRYRLTYILAKYLHLLSIFGQLVAWV